MNRSSLLVVVLSVGLVAALGLRSANRPLQAGTSPVEHLEFDLRDLSAGPDILRLHGSLGEGDLGVPVAGGADLDGDGHQDVAMASMTAYGNRGEVYLLLGDGTASGTFDTALSDPNILPIEGASASEVAGSEIWIDDVTGDGLGDLLICRQGFGDLNPNNAGIERPGAGALSIVVGSGDLRTLAQSGNSLELASPTTTVTTLVGADAHERLGIWVRTGDVDGDGIADLVVGADRRTHYPGESGCSGGSLENCDNGVAYVIRGGAHLAAGGQIDLADAEEPGFALNGLLAELRPPAPAVNFHLGGTVQIADLDGNDRAEVLVAATLNRAGASLGGVG